MPSLALFLSGQPTFTDSDSHHHTCRRSLSHLSLHANCEHKQFGHMHRMKSARVSVLLVDSFQFLFFFVRGKEKSHNIHTHRGAKTIHTYISDKSFAIFRKMLQLLVFISLVCFFSEIKLSNFTRQKSFRQTGLPNSNENFCFRYFQPFSLFISPQLLSSYRFRYLSLSLHF